MERFPMKKSKAPLKHSQTLENVWARTKPVVFYLNFPTKLFCAVTVLKSPKTIPTFLTFYVFISRNSSSCSHSGL